MNLITALLGMIRRALSSVLAVLHSIGVPHAGQAMEAYTNTIRLVVVVLVVVGLLAAAAILRYVWLLARCVTRGARAAGWVARVGRRAARKAIPG